MDILKEVLRAEQMCRKEKCSNLARLCTHQQNLFIAELLKDLDASRSDSSVGHDSYPVEYQCPITHDTMTDPVVAADGFSYEREAILSWFRQGSPFLIRSPMTGLRISGEVHPNQSMKMQIREWRERQGQIQGSSGSHSRASRSPNFCNGPRQRGGTLCMRSVVVRIHIPSWWPSEESGATLTILAAPIETAASLLFRLWIARERPDCLRPANCSLWHGLTDVGDGERTGHPLTLDEPLQRYTTTADQGTVRFQVEFELGKMYTPKHDLKQHAWSRLDCVKRLYDHFVNRVEAYNFATDVGLVLFSSSAELACKPTALIEDFRDQVDRAKSNGDTAVFDAVKLAAETLKAWREEQSASKPAGAESPALRVLVLSDGVDTKSSAVPWKVARNLQRDGIVLDAIHVGTQPMDAELHMLAKCTGGYVFKPQTVRDALRINELETVLHGPERPAPARLLPQVSSHSDLRAFRPALYPVDKADDTTIPPRRQPAQLSHRAVPLASVVEGARGDQAGDAPGSGGGAAGDARGNARGRQRRLLREMGALMQAPHPNFDVYPCESDMGFWRLVLAMDQATDMFTPYAQGCWLLYIMFPEEYPERPPEVRFVTPIRHCNVNAHGRICHSILDRNYTTDTPVSKILESVYALVLSPDAQDAVDATLALQCHEDLDAYRRAISEHVQRHASARNRQAWCEKLDEAEEEGAPPDAVEVGALSPASTIQELRDFIVRHNIPILTSGRGRTKGTLLRDILEHVGRRSSEGSG